MYNYVFNHPVIIILRSWAHIDPRTTNVGEAIPNPMNPDQFTAPAPAATVRLHGSINLQTIVETYRDLIGVLGDHAQVVIATDEVTDLDLTLVQLLDSARRTARGAGGSVTLAAPAQGALLAILQRGGFVETPCQRAFWLHSNEVQA